MFNTKKLLITLATAGLVLSSTGYAIEKVDILNKAAESKIAIKMILNENIASRQVDVHIHNKTMQFVGFVDNKGQYEAVQILAEKYTGDYNVINNVKILPVNDNRYDEAKLCDDVRKQLMDYKYPVGNIDIQARNGYVILSGFVKKHASLKDIEKTVMAVPGVKAVDNYLLYKKV